MSEPRDVVVVGAGVAGLAAAFRHAQRGDRVTVLERDARAGGRVASTQDGVDPFVARVTTADAALLALVRAAGVGDALLPIRPIRAARAEGGRVLPIAPGGDPRAVAGLPGVPFVQALRLFRLQRLLRRYRAHLDPAAPERAAPLDDRSLADFARLYFGQRVAAGWIEPWLAERAPVDERETSRAAFLLRWSAERDAVAGSFAAPLARLVEALSARVSIRSGVAATRIESAGTNRLRVAADRESWEADAVVLAVPAPEALRIAEPVLVAAERSILAGVRYDAGVAWSAPLRAGAAPGDAAWRIRSAPGGAHPFASIAIEDGRVTAIAREPWVSVHAAISDDALAKECALAADRLLPGFAEGAGTARRFPLAWPRFDVGRYRALARLRAVEADRRAAGRPLHFAGDWLAGPTLDGAVASVRSA